MAEPENFDDPDWFSEENLRKRRSVIPDLEVRMWENLGYVIRGLGQPGDTTTATARAARAFMDRIDNPTFLRIIETRALNGGWVGSREAGAWDPRVSDAISKAAVGAVIDLFRTWAAEPDEPPAEEC